MRNSKDGIIASQAGSLPRPKSLIDLFSRRADGEQIDQAELDKAVRDATFEVVRHQKELGIDVPGDGEFGKAMPGPVDYGAWWTYSFTRLGGLGLATEAGEVKQAPPARGNVRLGTFPQRRDWNIFAEAYADPTSGVSPATQTRRPFALPVCIGPLTYTGQDAIQKDIKNFKDALAANGVEEGFMTSLAPGSCSRIGNDYYKSEEEFVFACADAMKRGVQGDRRRRTHPAAG